MADILIRPAVAADTPAIYHFIRELAIYEKAEHEVVTTPEELKASIFAPDSSVRALLCYLDDQVVGFAVYFFNYSTWQGRNGLYLEDLYVSPQFRGVGAGKALLQYLAREAVALGCGRFEWSVLDWNEPAIKFYESIGARPQSEWIRYRLDGDALMSFAAGTEANPGTVPGSDIEDKS
ncbi:GNAT family N-acetyltransferase [Pseudohongiella sp. SYSU M77423]|uniref:GNAT family N-acetyltransferase n=1 Tax=unclassified Pseudohongiella TaxID=2629611 RepID=UPI000E9B18A5|nr:MULTISPECIES: GNAT family N-acetyltransferase [unclassified Pseudohongiella]MDH7943780.1 GNAT family N-acetyltransferase [Pseudohongiella sp. SYSU M77423]HBX36910.1 GNAT family N-acetyltransferase [Pseudohongiella sp.]|tara:strand:- start:725 stop:1258 length:534 start_codon:yes stop_codon:yes gene_type:complete